MSKINIVFLNQLEVFSFRFSRAGTWWYGTFITIFSWTYTILDEVHHIKVVVLIAPLRSSLTPFKCSSGFISYGKSGSGRGGSRADKPSDMWLHHDQMELASMMLDNDNGRNGNGNAGNGKRVAGSTAGSDGRCTDGSNGGSLPRRISEFDRKAGTSTSTLDRSRNYGSQYLSKSEWSCCTARALTRLVPLFFFQLHGLWI